MLNLFTGRLSLVLGMGDRVGGSHQPPESQIQKPLSVKDRVKAYENLVQESTPPTKGHVLDQETSSLKTMDTSQVKEQSGIDEQHLDDLVEKTKSGQLDESELLDIEKLSHLLDAPEQPRDIPPPPKDGPRPLTDEHVERILKGAVALGKLPDEKLARLPEQDRETLKGLTARMQEPENYKPNPDETKELDRICREFRAGVVKEWDQVAQKSGPEMQARRKDLDSLLGALDSLKELDDKYLNKDDKDTRLQPLKKNRDYDRDRELPKDHGEVQMTRPLRERIGDELQATANEVQGTITSETQRKLAQLLKPDLDDESQRGLEQFLNGDLSKLVKKLDGTLIKGPVYEKAQAQGKQFGEALLNTFEKDSLFLKNLRGLSEDQRREAIVQALGVVKPKHGGKAFDDLPEAKQRLVNSFLAGLNEAIVPRPTTKNELEKATQGRIVGQIRDEVSGLVKKLAKAQDPEQVYAKARETGETVGRKVLLMALAKSEFGEDWKALPDSKRKEAIAQAMGLLEDGGDVKFKDLPEEQQKLVNKVLEGMKQIPDRIDAQVDPPHSQDYDLHQEDLQDEGREKGRTIIAGLIDGAEDQREALFKLSNSPDRDLRDNIIETLGLVEERDKKLNLYDHLPEAQQKLVDSVLEGMKSEINVHLVKALVDDIDHGLEGLDVHNDNETREALRNAQETAKNLVAGSPALGELAFGLALKTDDEIKAAVTEALVRGNGQFARLTTEDQRDLINAIVAGIKDGFPNKVGEMETLQTTKGEKQVPQTITVDGKIYDSPKFIAQGGFGSVFRYERDKEDGTKEYIALKDILPNEGARKEMVTELQLHRNAMGPDGEGHRNLAGLQGVIRGDNKLYMVSEFVSGPNLLDMTLNMNKVQERNLLSESDNKLLRQYMGKTFLNGLIHIQEQRGMLHSDIKPDNVILDPSSGQSKIIDMGNSSVLESRTEAKGEVYGGGKLGSPNFRAPEVLDEQRATQESDRFAAGQTLYMLMTGKKLLDDPFDSVHEEMVKNLRETGEGVLTPETAFAKAINKTFTGRTEDREVLSELLKHPYFSDPLGSEERAKVLLQGVCEVNELYEKLVVDDHEKIVKTYLEKDAPSNTEQLKLQEVLLAYGFDQNTPKDQLQPLLDRIKEIQATPEYKKDKEKLQEVEARIKDQTRDRNL